MQIFIMCTYLYLLLNKYNHCNKTKNEVPLGYQYFFKAAFMKKKKQNSLKLNCVLLVGSYKVIEEIFTQSNPETVALFAFLETMFACSQSMTSNKAQFKLNKFKNIRKCNRNTSGPLLLPNV